jgi:DNA-binding transcriptional LysR family regulator
MDRLASLSVFCRVVESGGFSAAARRLNMSVTMVSKHVQALEDHLGARLLDRTTRKVSLTEIGRAYHERASQILAELEEADQLAASQQASPSGNLRLHTHTHIAQFLSPIIADYLARYPKVTVDVTTGERMVDFIEEGFDLALRTIPPDAPDLILRRLLPWRQMTCCAPAYLATHGALAHPRELAQRNCLQYAFFPTGNEWRYEHPDGTRVAVRVAGNFISNGAGLLRSMALTGAGILTAPSFMLTGDIASGALVQLFPEYRMEAFAIHALYPCRRHLSAKVRSFIDLLVERFADGTPD